MSRSCRPLILLALLVTGFGTIGADRPWQVISSATIVANMAKQIGGQYVEVSSVVPIGSDPHIYEVTPADARMINGADLILINGLTFEGWMYELIIHSGTTAPVVTVTDGVKPLRSTRYRDAVDPHMWMDASLALHYATNITNALIALDPQNTDYYRSNEADYCQALQELDRYIQTAIVAIPEERRILITSHDAFQYYGRRYGLRLEAVLGVSTEADVQTSDIRRLSSIIKRYSVPAVFIETTVNPKLLQQIARDHQITIGGQLYSDSLGPPGSGADTYISMLKYNTDVIVEALSGEAPFSSRSNGSSVPWYAVLFLVAAGLWALLFVVKKLQR